MRTSKYILRTSLMACFVSCCISFASADNPPFFTTDIKLNDKGEMLLTEKGMKRVYFLPTANCCVLSPWMKRRPVFWLTAIRPM